MCSLVRCARRENLSLWLAKLKIVPLALGTGYGMGRRTEPYDDHVRNSYGNPHTDSHQYEAPQPEIIRIYQGPTPPPTNHQYHPKQSYYSDSTQQYSGNVNRYHQDHAGRLSSHHKEPIQNLQTAVQESYSRNEANYNNPMDGRTHRRRRVINVKYYKKDPYEGKVPKGEGWVIEPIDGGFRAIKDERALNGWMHIYERAKVIHPSGNSGKTYWYFESIFDPPERVRHTRKHISKDGVQTEDLTPSGSGYFSHIKFDFDHAREAWKDVLPVLPTKDETLHEVMDREEAERVRRMRAYGSYYKEQYPDVRNNEDSYTVKQEPQTPNGLNYNPNENLKANHQYNTNHYTVPRDVSPNHRENTYNQPSPYQERNQASNGNQYPFDKARENYLDVSHLVTEIQDKKPDLNSYNVYSAESGPLWDHGYGSTIYTKAHENKRSHEIPPYNLQSQQQGPYNDNHNNQFETPPNTDGQIPNTKQDGKEQGFNFPQENRKNYYSFKKDSLMSDKNNQNLQGKPGELWVLRVYGFGYTDDNAPLNDLLQFDIEQNIGDTSEKYKNYIDSYDKNAVNIALEDDSMSKLELERAIEELIEFVFVKTNPWKTKTNPLDLGPSVESHKVIAAKGGTFNDKSYSYKPRRGLSPVFRPKPSASHLYKVNALYSANRKGDGHYSRNHEYEPNINHLNKVSYLNDKHLDASGKPMGHSHHINRHSDGEAKYYTGDHHGDGAGPGRPKFSQLDMPSNDYDEKPYDVMYVKKKIVTIEETIDGRQRRRASDVTETKRIARNKTKYPYLSYLPIPSEIKRRIVKRSVLTKEVITPISVEVTKQPPTPKRKNGNISAKVPSLIQRQCRDHGKSISKHFAYRLFVNNLK